VTLSSSLILGSVVPPPAISSSVFPSSSFLLHQVALSSHVSALASYGHDPATLKDKHKGCFYIYILLCLYLFYLFIFLLHLPSSVFTPLNIFLSIFLSYASNFISLFFVNPQVSHPYTTAGLITVLISLLWRFLSTLAFCLVNPLLCFLCSFSCLSPALLR
jgi:hypothetical protein